MLRVVVPQALLGEVDLAFLGTYAVGMFFAGHLGDRLDLRIFLTVGETCCRSSQVSGAGLVDCNSCLPSPAPLSAGMLGTGVFTIMFGMVRSGMFDIATA